MLDRRGFLVKSLGAGVVLATVGLPDLTTKAGAATLVKGYAPGQVMPPVVGLDQYNKTRRLTNYRGSWALVDLCPWWCPPCRASATRHAEFGRYIRANGIPFRIFSVVVENPTTGASHRFDAERWAEHFGLCNDIVLHCNGDPLSPLRNLVSQFGSANGNQAPGYPSYALIDPLGVVRYYQTGADLNLLQAQLAAFNNKTLTHTWDLVPAVDTVVGGIATAVTVNGKYSDGTPINETITLGGAGTNLEVFDSNFLPLDGFSDGITTIVPLDFDPDTPLSLTFTQTAPRVASPFTRMTGVDSTAALAPDDAITFADDNTASVDTSKVITPGGIVSSGANGITLSLLPINEDFFTPTTSNWSTVWFNQTENTPGPERWAMAYSLTDTLIADVADSTLNSLVKTAVVSQLKYVRNNIATRHFTAAGGHALTAEKKLALAGANTALQADVSWLASHLTDLANQL